MSKHSNHPVGLRRWICAAAAACLLTGIAQTQAADTDADGRLFAASENALGDVHEAMRRAADRERLLLVVLGANWCHDSRALASRLQRVPLSDVIQENYELVFVDAGYLDKGRDVMQRFGVAHYYATPTVLIVDPSSERLVNSADRHQWGNAYNIDMERSVRYFEKWSTAAASDAPPAVIAEIDAYELQLADRVAGGYAVVGPMLEALKAGNASEAFDARWNELRDFRTAIPGTIRQLKNEAQRRAARGDRDVQVDFPAFVPLSWEDQEGVGQKQ